MLNILLNYKYCNRSLSDVWLRVRMRAWMIEERLVLGAVYTYTYKYMYVSNLWFLVRDTFSFLYVVCIYGIYNYVYICIWMYMLYYTMLCLLWVYVDYYYLYK